MEGSGKVFIGDRVAVINGERVDSLPLLAIMDKIKNIRFPATIAFAHTDDQSILFPVSPPSIAASRQDSFVSTVSSIDFQDAAVVKQKTLPRSIVTSVVSKLSSIGRIG